MKANELMIGDWVNIHGDNWRATLATLQLAWDKPGTIKPIPLTAEILEKNGFKTEFYSDYKVYELNNFKVCKSYCDYFEACDLWKDSDFGWEIISFCPCIYVHELQHALKLCGIDKEIKL